jgi:hypothetical protein
MDIRCASCLLSIHSLILFRGHGARNGPPERQQAATPEPKPGKVDPAPSNNNKDLKFDFDEQQLSRGEGPTTHGCHVHFI